MRRSIGAITDALAALAKPPPGDHDLKASDDFLDPLFKRFYAEVGLPNLMRKTDYHVLAEFVGEQFLEGEIREKLDAIAEVARDDLPRGALS